MHESILIALENGDGDQTTWMYLSRIVRANLPNTVAPIIVAATLGVAAAILSEAYTSFLGLGVQAPRVTWGTMLDQAYHHLDTEPWMWFFPGILIVLTVLSINFLGDGLRNALDPKMQNQVLPVFLSPGCARQRAALGGDARRRESLP